MGIRSQNNPIASFLDVFSNTGTDASKPYVDSLKITGGTVNPAGLEPGNTWTYHTFTSSGSLVIEGPDATQEGITAEFFVIGGGGAGGVANDNGSDGGGGAGAGNVNSYSNFTVATIGEGTYNIVVGGGANAFPGPPSPGNTVEASQVGTDTTVTKVGPGATLTAKGGGGGGHGPLGGPVGPHANGGSGGGGGGGGGAANGHYGDAITNTPQPLLPGATITQRGNIGTRGNNPPYFGGGGGGAGGVGIPGTGPSSTRGRGGAAFDAGSGYNGTTIGVPAVQPHNGHYGGGGPGGSGGPGNNPSVPGPPGGPTPNNPGSPASDGPRVGGTGSTNTGAGGGGASGAPSPPGPGSPGGAGGSGMVVFRYQKS